MRRAARAARTAAPYRRVFSPAGIRCISIPLSLSRSKDENATLETSLAVQGCPLECCPGLDPGFLFFNFGFKPRQLFRVCKAFAPLTLGAMLALHIPASHAELIVRVSPQHRLSTKNREEYSVRLSSQNTCATIAET